MINVTTKVLRKHGISGLSISFYQHDQTFPGKGNRKVVMCEVWSPSGSRWGVGRAIMNPLDTFNSAIGCRKALSNALSNAHMTQDERREVFAKINWAELA